MDHDIPRSISALQDTVETINEIRFQESEALYTTKDSAIKEGLQRVKEKISSESDYDRRRRQKQVADLRHAVTVLEALYRRLEKADKEGE